MATFNCPELWHDSTIADHRICKTMLSVHNRCGEKAVVKSAFKSAKLDNLIQSSQEDPVLKDTTCQEACRAIDINTQAASLRQFLECGMTMIQGQFPRLKDNMQCKEAGKQKTIMHLMILLCNHQTEKVGINQMLNSFMSRTKGFPQRPHAHCNNTTELSIVHKHARTIFQFEKKTFESFKKNFQNFSCSK